MSAALRAEHPAAFDAGVEAAFATLATLSMRKTAVNVGDARTLVDAAIFEAQISRVPPVVHPEPAPLPAEIELPEGMQPGDLRAVYMTSANGYGRTISVPEWAGVDPAHEIGRAVIQSVHWFHQNNGYSQVRIQVEWQSVGS